MTGLIDADRISAAVLACPDVAAMSAGAFGEVRSYLPGRSVPGVRIGDEAVEVHVVARYGSPLPAVAARIDRAVTRVSDGRAVRVVIEDIQLTDGES
jgi:uncharacterized alkaline shock family protein YloU